MVKRNGAERGGNGRNHAEKGAEARAKKIEEMQHATDAVTAYLFSVKIAIIHLLGAKRVSAPPTPKPGRKAESVMTHDQYDFYRRIDVAQQAGDALFTKKDISDEEIGLSLYRMSEATREVAERGKALFPEVKLPALNKKQAAQWAALPFWAGQFLPAGPSQSEPKIPEIPMPEPKAPASASLAEQVDWTGGETEDSSLELIMDDFFEKPRTSANSREDIRYRTAVDEMMRTRAEHLIAFEESMRVHSGDDEFDREQRNKKAVIAIGHFRIAFKRFLEELNRMKGDERAEKIRARVLKKITATENALLQPHMPRIMSERAQESPKRKDLGTAFAIALAALVAGGSGVGITARELGYGTPGALARYLPDAQRRIPPTVGAPSVIEPSASSRRSLSEVTASAFEVRADARAAARASAPVPEIVVPNEIPSVEPVQIMESLAEEPVLQLSDTFEPIPLIQNDGIGGEEPPPVEPVASAPPQEP